MSAADSSVSTVGRPRNPDTEGAVFEAVLDLINEGATLSSLALVAVGQRAGRSRNSLYRRWSTKEDLYIDVLKSTEPSARDVQEHSARETLVRLLGEVVERSADERLGRFDRAVYFESLSYPRLRERYDEAVIAPRFIVVRRAIRRGKETGEIRLDVDENLLCEVLLSLVWARTFSGATEQLDAGLEMFTDLVFDGATPR